MNLNSFSPTAKPRKNRIRWKLDMIGQLGVFKRDAGDVGNPLSSPAVAGDLVFCVTGNGSKFGYEGALAPGTPYVPKATAPSFIAVHKLTGKLAWSSAAPGKEIQYGQWGSPAVARVGKVEQVLFPGGDGWLYGFEAPTGREIWKVDCNDPSATRWAPKRPGTRTAFLSAPVVRDQVAYIGAAIDLEQTDLRRPLYAIDLTHKGNATRKAIKWTFHDKGFGGTFGAVALGKETLYAVGNSGIFIALDLKTGTEQWRSDFGATALRFNSPCVHSGRVFVPAGTKLFIFQDNRQRKPAGEFDLEEEILGTPIVVDQHLYIATRKYLYCLRLLD